MPVKEKNNDGPEKKKKKKHLYTLPEANIAPKNGWLEYYVPFWDSAYFQGIC